MTWRNSDNTNYRILIQKSEKKHWYFTAVILLRSWVACLTVSLNKLTIASKIRIRPCLLVFCIAKYVCGTQGTLYNISKTLLFILLIFKFNKYSLFQWLVRLSEHSMNFSVKIWSSIRANAINTVGIVYIPYITMNIIYSETCLVDRLFIIRYTSSISVNFSYSLNIYITYPCCNMSVNV